MPDTCDLPDWSDTVATYAPMQSAACELDAPNETSAQWAVTCSRRILELDSRIEAACAAHLALFMSSRANWRQHSPHEAAERLYRLTATA